MLVDIIFVVLVIILVLAIYKLKFKNDAVKIANTNINQLPVARPQTNNQLNAQQPPIQQPNRPRWAQQQAPPQQTREDDQSDESDDQDKSNTIVDRRKQLRKQQKAKLKQQKKEALEHHLQEQKQKREKQEEEELEKQRIEQQKKKKEEQYYRMLAEQEQKRKKAEYDKWKGMFKVQTEGKSKESAEVEQQKKEDMLKNLLKILQKNKLSLLEDLAHKLKLTTKQLIQKIKQLEVRGDVKGIFDERGKYLVIQQKEWEAIKNYIQARGRIKKTDIMQQCARIIKIPDNTEVDQQILNLIEKQSQNQN